MKTKELIQRLQEEDPSGECQIILPSGDPLYFIESKPAYWDGPLHYVEKDSENKINWISTTRGDKIELGSFDLFLMAERYKGNWEEMKKHVKVDYTYLDDGQRSEEFMRFAKKECDEYYEMLKTFKKS
jgi:hypothetical protein